MSLSQNPIRRLLRGRTNVGVQLLSRPGCHLCDEAELAVRREFGDQNVQSVNILDNTKLEEQYVFRIPVILYEGKPVAEGQIGRHEARRARQAILRQRRKIRLSS